MKNKNYIIATIRPWNTANFKQYFGTKPNFHLIDQKGKFTLQKVKSISPTYIFFPHWSWMIPESICRNYECVIFHTAPLPYGRGGSPIQNLIMNGFSKTSICALKATTRMDAGPIYLRRSLSLSGTAEAIFRRLSKKVFSEMIPFIVKNEPRPLPQTGKVTIFKRRKPIESSLSQVRTLTKLYDFIRMLDAPEYPKAFLETKNMRIEFSKAVKTKNNVVAKAEIYEK